MLVVASSGSNLNVTTRRMAASGPEDMVSYLQRHYKQVLYVDLECHCGVCLSIHDFETSDADAEILLDLTETGTERIGGSYCPSA